MLHPEHWGASEPAGSPVPDPPAGLKAGGERLWRDVTGRYELQVHEELLLTEMCRTVDQLDELAAVIAAGELGSGMYGSGWAVAEARQQRIAFARLAAVLRLPAGTEGTRQAGERPPPRPGGPGAVPMRRSPARPTTAAAPTRGRPPRPP